MNSQQSARIYSAAGTLLLAAAIVWLLLTCALRYSPAIAQADTSTLVIDEFIEFDDYSADVETNIDGIPLADDSAVDHDYDGTGDPGGAPSNVEIETHASESVITTPRPSEVKEKKQPQMSEAEKRAAEEQARQRREQQAIESEVGGAFGPSATPGQASSSQSASGNASNGSPSGQANVGHIGRGWGLPAFGNVNSNVTGTVIVKADINAEGYVTEAQSIPSVSINGRNYNSLAPAGSDNRVIRGCVAEVKSKRFPRTGQNDGKGTIAYIVFNFN